MRAVARTSFSERSSGPMHSNSASRVCHTGAAATVRRYCSISSSTRSAVRRSASSRSAMRLPLRKKLRTAVAACCAM